MKTCSKCKHKKNIDQFIGNIPSKITSQCKKCRDIKRLNNIKNKTTIVNYRIKNKEHNLQKCKEYYGKNKEKILIRTKDYQENNKEQIIIKNKAHKIQNKELYLWRFAKRRAKEKNILFNLNVEDILIPEIDPYLEYPLYRDGKVSENIPSIDRINNNLGYIKTNIIVVSQKANRIKNNLSLDEIKLIAKNYDNIGIESEKSYYKNNILIEARKRSKKLNLDFNLELDDIIVPDECPLLNIKLFTGSNKPIANSPTLDRIDNNLGYIKGNVRVISLKSNISKSNSTKEEYLLFAKNLENIVNNRYYM